VFGPGGEETTAVWRKFRNEDLHKLHSLTNVTRITQLRKVYR